MTEGQRSVDINSSVAAAPEPPDGHEVLALSMAVLDQSMRLGYAVTITAIASALLGILIVLIDGLPDAVGLVIEALAAGFLLASFGLLSLSQSRYQLGLELRRASVLRIGLGLPLPKLLITSLRDRAGRRARRALPTYLPRAAMHFTYKSPPGASRVREMIQESAFFTWHLYRDCSRILFAAIAVLLVAAILLSWVALIPTADVTTRIHITRVVVSLIPAVISVGLLSPAVALRSAANAIERIDGQLEQLDGHSNDVQVLRLLGEFNCQATQGIALPRPLYLLRRAELNGLWQERITHAE
jgi:hypothetical protein